MLMRGCVPGCLRIYMCLLACMPTKSNSMVLGSFGCSQYLQFLIKIMNIFSYFSCLFILNLMANSV